MDFGSHLRVTSYVVSVVSSLDLEEAGFDAFLEGDASDAALGALIREGLDRTRFMAFEDNPYLGVGSGGFYRKLAAWKRRAKAVIGDRSVFEVDRTARSAEVLRSRSFYLFLNHRRVGGSRPEFVGVSDVSPDYCEIVLEIDAEDAEIGACARDILSEMVTGGA